MLVTCVHISLIIENGDNHSKSTFQIMKENNL